MAETEQELESLLIMVKESEKAGLKLNIQKTKIMASGPITPWQIDRETKEKSDLCDIPYTWHLKRNGCETCTINKAEHQRIDAFELLC